MNHLSKVFLVISILCQIYQIRSDEFAPIVTTKKGQLRGIIKELDDGRKVYLYQGVQYGKPPTGELRFQRPIASSSWEGVYNATHYRYACYQPDEIYPDNNIPEEAPQSEDCLYVNVWQPAAALPNGKKRSVMAWFHGGGFETGTIFSLAYDARYLAAVGDVIIVTVNYRIGPFGFLYAGTNDTQGNAGLYDQTLALKWIQENIEAFGGDSTSVTIFGESAGGASVGALVLSPVTHGLFKRAIMQSGAPNSYTGGESNTSAIAKTKSLAKQLNCTDSAVNDMIKCLRSKDPIEFTKITRHARANGESHYPTYNTEFLPTKPTDALKNGQFNQNIDFMFGHVSNEGALFTESIFPDMNPTIKNPTITLAIAKGYIEFLYLLFKENYGSLVSEFYLKGLNDSDKDGLRKAVSYSFGDYHLVCPTMLFGLGFTKWNKANRGFAYRVSYPPAISVFPLCGKNGGWMGVCHGDDVIDIFGFPIRLRGIGYGEDDYKLSMDMINAWTTFAKTGTPAKINNIEWTEAIDHNNLNATIRHMELHPKNYKMVEGFYKESCETFWRKRFAIEF